MHRILRIFFFILLLTGIGEGKIINVPADYSSIQAAIENSTNGDTILVAQGTYEENINFKGKNIVLSSNYIFNNDPSIILSTIIDGGHSSDPDFQSCVMMVSGEDSSAVLEGFTLTNGKGSKWVDEHGAGTYREGGGVLITLSSPTIKNNLIINNEAIDKKGMSSAGGGGLRIGDGNPKILNNVIMRNKGLYGAGITLNYTGAFIRNNIIYQNDGGSAFGGAGVWCYQNSNKGYKIILENNTIANNFSSTDGGGVLIWETQVIARNNIIWGNNASLPDKGGISFRTNGSINITFSDIQDSLNGEGNIKQEPLIDITDKLLLKPASPCIDAGNPAQTYNDPSDLTVPSNASLPSMGLVRNDMGAYGGKYRKEFPDWQPVGKIGLLNKSVNFQKISIGDTGSINFSIVNFGDSYITIDSVKISKNPENFFIGNSFPLSISPSTNEVLTLFWIPSKTGFLRDTLIIYHSDQTAENPQKINLQGSAVQSTGINEKEGLTPKFYLSQNFPNPFNPSTNIEFSISEKNFVNLTIFDMLGRKVIVLLNEERNPGLYLIKFNSGDINLQSGIYFYKLTAGNYSITKKFVLIK